MEIQVEEVVKDIKIAIIGSRKFNDYEYFKKTINRLILNYKKFSFVSGDAKGADKFAERYAKDNNIEINIIQTKWYVEGVIDNKAGYDCNIEIWKNSDIGIAFWDGKSKGTAHSFKLAKKQKKKTIYCKL